MKNIFCCLTKSFCTFIVLLLLLFLTYENSYAATRKATCRPGICISQEKVPIKKRRYLRSGEYFVTLPRVKELTGGVLSLPPESDDVAPLSIKLAAERLITHRCTNNNGVMDCYEIVTVSECPRTVVVQDGAAGPYYICNVTCTGPDGDGNCDCDITPNTCTAS